MVARQRLGALRAPFPHHGLTSLRFRPSPRSSHWDADAESAGGGSSTGTGQGHPSLYRICRDPDATFAASDTEWADGMCRGLARSLDGLDTGESQLLAVDSRLDSSGLSVVDGALAAQSQERLAFAVQHRHPEPGVLLVASQW